MSKDFARVSSRGTRSKSSGSKHKAKPPVKRWPAFYAGLTLGLGVAVVVYLVENDKLSLDSVWSSMQGKGPVSKSAPVKQAPKPDFVFYTILPEMEVVVPEREEPASTPAAKSETAPAAEPGPTGSYLLQAGSFRKMSDADSLKASLALLGFSARIEKVTIDRTAYHRVRIGPYSSFEQADRVGRRLRTESIDTMMLRLKK